MIARYGISIALGAAVAFGLLFVMQLLIATGNEAMTEVKAFRVTDFVRVDRNELIQTRRDKPDKPPEPDQPPDMPAPDTRSNFDSGISVSVSAPMIHSDVSIGTVGFGVSDGEYLPIVKVAPVYPNRALTRGLEGYVIVEFTVTRTGTVRDVFVVESTSALFERAAVEAAMKFKYRPRVIDGVAVEVPGVRNKITFEIQG